MVIHSKKGNEVHHNRFASNKKGLMQRPFYRPSAWDDYQPYLFKPQNPGTRIKSDLRGSGKNKT